MDVTINRQKMLSPIALLLCMCFWEKVSDIGPPLSTPAPPQFRLISTQADGEHSRGRAFPIVPTDRRVFL